MSVVHILLEKVRVRSYCESGDTQFVVQGCFRDNKYNVNNKLFGWYVSTLDSQRMTPTLIQALALHEDGEELKYSEDKSELTKYTEYQTEREHWF